MAVFSETPVSPFLQIGIKVFAYPVSTFLQVWFRLDEIVAKNT